MLRITRKALNAGKSKPGLRSDLAGQGHSLRDTSNSGTGLTDIGIDDNRKRRLVESYCLGGGTNLLDVIDRDRERTRSINCRQPCERCKSTTGAVRSKFGMPAAVSISTSPTVAHAMPIAPASICKRAISTDLWVFAWGRKLTPDRLAIAAM